MYEDVPLNLYYSENQILGTYCHNENIPHFLQERGNKGE